jgi:N-acetylneuraminic acid mutarotase
MFSRLVLLLSLALLVQTAWAQDVGTEAGFQIRWEAGPVLNRIGSQGVTAVIDGELYVIRGHGTNLPERYSPGRGTWETRAALPKTIIPYAGGPIGGLVFTAGGHGGSSGTTFYSDVFSYDPVANQWTLTGNLPETRSYHSGSVYQDKVYVVGGKVSWTGNLLTSVYSYDPADGTTERLADLPTSRAFLGAAWLDGKFYAVGGGETSSSFMDIVEVYDPESDSWSTTAPLNIPRNGIFNSVVGANGHLIVIGGVGASGRLTSVEVYDPASNEWSLSNSIQQGRSGISVAIFDGKIWAMGGFGQGNTNLVDVGTVFIDGTEATAGSADLSATPAGDDVQAGTITTVAGTGANGFAGDGGPAVHASLFRPQGIFIDSSGSLYIADSENNRIRKIDTSGTIATIAGGGDASGSSTDGGPAIDATLADPADVFVDGAGNVFIADLNNNVVRKVDVAGTITTIAGNSVGGFAGDGGPAAEAMLNFPRSILVDRSGELYIADTRNNRIRKIDSSGTITTVAGLAGSSGSTGDGGEATRARLNSPHGIFMDDTGNLYIADRKNHSVRMIDPSGKITTVAGGGRTDGDGGPAIEAVLRDPVDVSVDGAGNLFIAELNGHAVRKVDVAGIITTVVGSTFGYSGDGGPADQAKIGSPNGIFVDIHGNLFVSSSFSHRVRVAGEIAAPTPLAVGVFGSSGSPPGGPTSTPALYVSSLADGTTNADPAELAEAGLALTFTEPVDTDRLQLAVSSGGLWQQTWTSDGTRLTLRPASILDLAFNTTYQVTLSSLQSSDGAAFQDVSLSFTTGAAPQIALWPGDTNDDGAVDAKDIIPIGVFWRAGGAVRSSANSIWQERQTTSWISSRATRADANGDGIVNQADVDVIVQNWRLDRSQVGKSAASAKVAAHELLDALSETDDDGPFGVIKSHLEAQLDGGALPDGYALSASYPNPFNSSAVLEVHLPVAVGMRLTIYNIDGQVVRTLADGPRPAGVHRFTWDGRDDSGKELSSGVYLCQVHNRHFSAVRRMALIR